MNVLEYLSLKISKALFNFSTKNERIRIKNGITIHGGNVSILGNDSNIYIKEGYKKNPHLYSVIKMILREVVKIDYILYEVDSVGTKRKVKNGLKHQIKSHQLTRIDEHEILKLLAQPNEIQAGPEFIESVIGYKMITGDSFIHRLFPDNGVNAGITKELWSIAPPIVRIATDSHNIPVRYEVSVGGLTTKVPAEEMIHLKAFNPEISPNGMSPIQAAAFSLKSSNDNYLAQMRLTQNGSAAGILKYADDESLDEKDTGTSTRDRLESRYYERYGGANNYGKIMVTNADITWTNMGLNAIDLELLEGQKMDLRDIANVYGVSSNLLNDPEQTGLFTSSGEARKELINNVVVPEINLYLGELNRSVVPAFEKRDGKQYLIAADLSVYPELREDVAKQTTMLNNAWWLTPNQKLLIQGYEENIDPLMDLVYIPQGFTPINISDDDLLKSAFGQGKT